MEIKINEKLDSYYKSITISDLAQGVMNKLTWNYNHFTLNEMMKELGLLTSTTEEVTKTGRQLCFEYFCGHSGESIKLIKPNETLEYIRK